MSFAIWTAKPPFSDGDLNAGEQIHRVGDYWVVTDQGAPTLEQVQAALQQSAPASRAEQMVAAIKSDPAALALLKSELAKV